MLLRLEGFFFYLPKQMPGFSELGSWLAKIVFLPFTWAMRGIWFQFLVLHLFKQSSEKDWSGGHFLAKEGKAKEWKTARRKKGLTLEAGWDLQLGCWNNGMIQQESEGASCQKLHAGPDVNFGNRVGFSLSMRHSKWEPSPSIDSEGTGNGSLQVIVCLFNIGLISIQPTLTSNTKSKTQLKQEKM